jgi:hypothetical protein
VTDQLLSSSMFMLHAMVPVTAASSPRCTILNYVLIHIKKPISSTRVQSGQNLKANPLRIAEHFSPRFWISHSVSGLTQTRLHPIASPGLSFSPGCTFSASQIVSFKKRQAGAINLLTMNAEQHPGTPASQCSSLAYVSTHPDPE